MKKLTIAILIFFFGISLSYAQVENTKKPLKIKSVEESPKSNKSLILSSSKPNAPSLKVLGNKNNDKSPVDPKSNFKKSPSNIKGISEKQSGGYIDPKFKKDQYLGDFKSNSESLKFICRDHEYVDGDRVRILVNDVVIQDNVLLQGSFRGFKIDLEKGFNKIDIVALNQGTSGPNTAEFRVYDDQNKLVSSNLWNLATGVKATIIIVKE